MEIRYSPNPDHFTKMNTDEIRDNFLVESLFVSGQIPLLYCDVDRVIIGSAVPLENELSLDACNEIRAEYFCQRRELGVLNIGQSGAVTVDGKRFEMGNLDVLYIGKGSRQISFESDDASKPAKFYLVSYPAHAEYPTKHADKSQALRVELGNDDQCNKRVIYKYIHPDGIESCQLVMGFTIIEPGSVWNTMPPHTHGRRMEAYLYFNFDQNNRVFHFMGKPNQTRHVVVAPEQALISPSWSIHSGVGTQGYCFCWAMGGENQAFDDMDGVSIADIK